jgi:pimeloyl-ACP methyl ester carboxylesterase
MSEIPVETTTAPTPAPVPAKEVVTEARYTISEYWLNGTHGAMRYWKSEPAHKVPIVFVHGYGAVIEHWRRIMRPVAREHTLTALDLYGFGYSAYPRATPSKELWAEQVAELITTVLQQPAIVVGHSMGGMVAAQTACEYPELVRGLVLVNSTGLPDNRDNTMSPMDLLFFAMVRMPVLGELLAGAYGTPWGARQGLMQAYYRKECVTEELVEAFSGPLRRPGAGNYYLSVSRALDKVFLDIAPGQLAMPKLLIWGTEDDSMPATQATRFKRELLPDAEIAFLSESGHCPFDEQPDQFCTALLSWIDRAVVG